MKQVLIKWGKTIVADVPAPLVEPGHVLVGGAYSHQRWNGCQRHPDQRQIHLHAQQAIKADWAGKAIFLEKPMALNREELDRLVVALRLACQVSPRRTHD